jgi:Domain of unknown function (DUF4157)
MDKLKRPARKRPAQASGKDTRESASSAAKRPPSAPSLLDLQQSAGNVATGRIIGGMLVQAKERNAGDVETPFGAETTPDAMPDNAVAPEGPQSEPGKETQGSETAPAAAVVVDDAVDAGPGQMKKSDFIARLRAEVSAAAEAALGGTEHAGSARQPIDMWLGSYEGQDVARINRDLTRFAGEESRLTTAEEYVALVAERVRTSAATWARTGELTGLPPGLSLPGADLPGAGGLLGGLGSLGGVFFKARQGGTRDPGDPRAVQGELGDGRPLDGAVRTRMESALGHSFSGVRVHTDGAAHGLADRLNAKAFTVGQHVAFGAREYRPGTLVGDALLAHELAHVVQQGASADQDVLPPGGTGAMLEADADRSALGAVTALWGKSRLTGPGVSQRASGLRLQRCALCGGSAAAPAQRRILSQTAECSVPDRETWTRDVDAAAGLQGDQRRDTMATLLQRALCDTGRRVAVAGGGHADRVHPDDYEKLPVINFDVRLNQKQSRDGSRTLSRNHGYSFDRGDDKYVVLGPKAVDNRSPTHVHMYLDHELYHTEHHLGGQAPARSDADEELETYTVDFRNYFHQLRSFRTQWGPLIEYYEEAGSDAQARSLTQLVDYYNNPPVPEPERESVRRSFAQWLRRRLGSDEHRDKRLIQDLESRLHLGRN